MSHAEIPNSTYILRAVLDVHVYLAMNYDEVKRHTTFDVMLVRSKAVKLNLHRALITRIVSGVVVNIRSHLIRIICASSIAFIQYLFAADGIVLNTTKI